MSFIYILIYIGKLLLCGLVFSVGTIIGGVACSLLGLQPPQLPENYSAASAIQNLILESPLLALALVVVARGIAGSFLLRAGILSFLTWIAYTVNTQLEAMIFSTIRGGFWFTVVGFLVPSLMCGAAVALLFSPVEKVGSLVEAWKVFFRHRTVGDWIWRLAIAAVIFMPIYYFFGLLVAPFTKQYYQHSMYGLKLPGLEPMLTILFVRSILFLLACVPVIVMWQKSMKTLILSLGFTLFLLVGFLNMIAANYLPLSVRVPHILEILADSLVYTSALVLLLCKRYIITKQEDRVIEQNARV